jgi:hypothetical protein
MDLIQILIFMADSKALLPFFHAVPFRLVLFTSSFTYIQLNMMMWKLKISVLIILHRSLLLKQSLLHTSYIFSRLEKLAISSLLLKGLQTLKILEEMWHKANCSVMCEFI